ncbi:DUF4435 domain-containing protein [Haliscomenobacter hydrossis]|uniref:DUF4435 domain-containing protein n=1 Tax=Haliscomenobacter hydrossis (strain ATCC 27775 / DSM 1100 / LMG 10767 / O) TaxID=760192 RepID=F4KQH4_HALH1|nr:DUF4435 domain-containing protein [Haliscomenobacter hydrossis]AEE49963.1 hypothetical protein Halhy_2078 [Haliscomenobacter hydrossis DSM 1100]
MPKQRPAYSPEEILESLKYSALSGPIVYLEGVDDVKIFRDIAHRKGIFGSFSFEQLGARNTLLNLFELYDIQKAKIKRPILFFADQDTWVFSGIPAEYQEIHFTKGYSIENDLFEDGKEFILALLYDIEKERFAQLIESVSEWFAREAKLILNGNSEAAKIDLLLLNPSIISPGANGMNEAYQIDATFRADESQLIVQIKQQYTKLLRGKFLFELLQRLSLDRGNNKENLPIPNESSLFSTCIAEGIRKEDSHCQRIATILQNVI